MPRRGYTAELKVKKILLNRYGVDGVVKIAISQSGCDFLCMRHGILQEIVEVKETHKKKYYPSKKHKKQFIKILKFADYNKTPARLYVVIPRQKIKIYDLRKFMENGARRND